MVRGKKIVTDILKGESTSKGFLYRYTEMIIFRVGVLVVLQGVREKEEINGRRRSRGREMIRSH